MSSTKSVREDSKEAEFGDCASGLHERVLELLEKEKRGILLDAPAGLGELSFLFKEKGFDVMAGDIDENIVKAKNFDFKKFDLNQRLPFEDEAFDYVVNVEGLEHLENPHHTISEFTRILKKKGKMILTTPNVLNVFSRLRYFLIGYHEHFGDYYANEDHFYVYHINPVGFPEIALALKKNNLIVEEITTNQCSLSLRGWITRVFLKILCGIIKYVSKAKIKDQAMREHLLSKPLLEGEILILKCRKES
jgi:SAM-dependent methyltransferase